MKKVTVVNYGIGNLLSVERALTFCDAKVEIATTPEEVMKADRLVVPGVGAFKKCMEALEQHALKDSLLEFAASGKPYLGICVGMQMLMTKSEEFGLHDGLNLIAGDVKKIDVPGFRVPFIGWKEISLGEQARKFYFVHSFHAQPTNREHIFSSYTLGDRKIVAAVQKDNVTGVQFHPEKSGEAGMAFLSSFLNK